MPKMIMKKKSGNWRKDACPSSIKTFEALKTLSKICYSEVKEVDMRDDNRSSLNQIPKEIFDLTNLQKLNLKGESIRDLPQKIGNLTNLTYLNLSRNNLRVVPPPIKQLTRLEFLSLDDNNIRVIPDFVANLPKLRSLGLFNNDFLSLPQNLCLKLKYGQIESNVDYRRYCR